MDSSKLIHVVAELVLIVGVVAYFHMQIKALRSEVRQLRALMDKQLPEHSRHINQLYDLLNGMLTRPPVVPVQPQQLTKSPPARQRKQEVRPMELRYRGPQKRVPNLDEELDEELRDLEHDDDVSDAESTVSDDKETASVDEPSKISQTVDHAKKN